MTWQHKNHLRLLDAIAHLRDKCGQKIRLVCTGSRLEPYWTEIEKHIERLQLGNQVSFLGFVTEKDLRAIYKLAQFLVMPSLFESDSSPVYEAWLEGLPVACSNVTSLPVQARDAALLFDPYNIGSIANSISRLANQSELRRELRDAGFRRLKDFDWARTAKAMASSNVLPRTSPVSE